MDEGTINMPFDLEADRLARLAASEQESDPHKAFHIRSALRFPDPDGLCAQCAEANSGR